jgi:hypothetical protein
MRRVGMALIASALSATAVLGLAGNASAAFSRGFEIYGWGTTPEKAQDNLQYNVSQDCKKGAQLLDQETKWDGTQYESQAEVSIWSVIQNPM